jgi:hypothetical protein
MLQFWSFYHLTMCLLDKDISSLIGGENYFNENEKHRVPKVGIFKLFYRL